MATHISHFCLPYPIKHARYTVQVPYLDGTGVPTDPTTPTVELSLDGAAFAAAAEAVTVITGGDGGGFHTLTGAETNVSAIFADYKAVSGPKATLMPLGPRVLAVVASGTLAAGSAGGGTLGGALAYNIAGCFLRTTGGTGGGGTGGANNQARKIITYTTTTGVFTVAPNWETTPSTDTTYDVLAPEGVTLEMILGATALDVSTPEDVAAAVFARVFSAAYGSHTFDELIKIIAVAASGVASGLSGTTATYRNLANSGDVLVATVDQYGNRSAVTRTP